MKFTATEIEILKHRLAVMVLETILTPGNDILPESLSSCERDVLVDCCNGSTFFGGDADLDAVATGELSKGVQLQRQKAAKTLEDKLNKAGLKVYIPRS